MQIRVFPTSLKASPPPVPMTKKLHIILLSLLAISSTHLQAASQPNILFIFADDLGWRDTTFMGSDFYETPHLDQLANEGMIFTNAYSGAANCAPARACLLSGQYSPRHEIYNVGTKPRGDAKHRKLLHTPGVATLRPDISTWAQQLQKAGYQTASIGKWHLSKDPVPYGFHFNFAGTHSGSPPKGYYPPHGKVPGLKNSPPGEYLTDRLNAEAIKFIKKNREHPWMIYLTHFAVHTPLQPKKELLEKYKNKEPGKLHQHAIMATMIQAVDDGVGRLIQTLKDLNIEDNTVVIFYSDNGGYGPATDMDPLKGYKGTYYEGGIRVPLAVNWPGVIKPGSESSTPVTGVDIYPTLCEIAGAELPTGQVQDGLSLVPLLRGKKSAPLLNRPLFWHFPAYLQSYGGPPNNLEQRDPLFRSRPCSIVRLGNWKLHEYFEDGELELYNLKTDIGESQNLAKSKPGKTAELHQLLKDWRQKIKAPVPSTPNPDYDPLAEAEAIRKNQ